MYSQMVLKKVLKVLGLFIGLFFFDGSQEGSSFNKVHLSNHNRIIDRNSQLPLELAKAQGLLEVQRAKFNR